MNNKRNLLAIGLLGALLTASMVGGRANAGDTPASGQQLLDQVAQRLSTAKSISADVEEVDSYPGRYKDLAQRGTVEVARPNLLNLQIHRFRRVSAADPWAPSGNDIASVSDGKSYTYAFLHPHSTQIRRSDSSTETVAKALTTAPSVAGFFAATATAQPGSAQLLAPATWEGASYQVVQYSVASDRGGDPITAAAYVGQDQLIHHLVYTRQSPKGAITREWNLRNVRVDDSVPASAFAYTPPADATELAPASADGPLAEGSTAPDFTLTDRSGHPVKLSDYRGKTVVLDFWATWCWPCNQSLPHAQETVHAYQSKNVVALAIAIRDSKKGFDTWVSKHDYPDLNFVFDGIKPGVGDPATDYHVETTPTTYVIGPDGKVVRSIVGFTGPNTDLASALDAAQATTVASH